MLKLLNSEKENRSNVAIGQAESKNHSVWAKAQSLWSEPTVLEISFCTDQVVNFHMKISDMLASQDPDVAIGFTDKIDI